MFFIFLLNLGVSCYAAEPDIENWYEYNSNSTIHSFSVRFPTDWQARTLGSDIQGFGPKEDYDKDPVISIQEFPGSTYGEVINYFKTSTVTFLSSEDFLFKTPREDLIARKAIFLDKSTGDSYEKIFLKRGSFVIVISINSDEFADISPIVIDSLKFTDNWRSYLNYNDKYTFIIPTDFALLNINGGVQINNFTKNPLFSVIKYADTSVDKAKNIAQQPNESIATFKEINFHGIDNAIEVEYQSDDNVNVRRVIIGKNGDAYVLSNPANDSSVLEIFESFEYFNIQISGDNYPSKYFSDIRDNHPNAESINTLAGEKIINGYSDHTFKPDASINRAELTKMIVVTRINPDKTIFKNCFPDVQEQWFAPYICYAKAKGWVQGYKDGTFRPENNVNRAEALKILLGVMFLGKISENEVLKNNTVTDIDKNAWYFKYFTFADNRGFLDKQHIIEKGEKYQYLPEANISRKEVAETIYRGQKSK